MCRRWAEVREQAEKLAGRRDEARGDRARRINNDLSSPLSRSAEEIASVRVLDPRLRFRELPERFYAEPAELIAFARADDYFLGVLHSRAHELWARRMATWMGVGNDLRYTPTTRCETFPLPWPPGAEPEGDSRIEAIAEPARRLDELRRNWLDPEGASEAELKKRTLTNLYNARPTWLENAHERLEAAVFAAYGWTPDLSNEEVLQKLLALNRARAGECP